VHNSAYSKPTSSAVGSKTRHVQLQTKLGYSSEVQASRRPIIDTEELRVVVYRRFALGELPTVADLAKDLARPDAAVGAGLQSLAEQRHVVLGADGEIVMAHPFSAVPLGFSVMGRNRLWWGGCAWDAFALPHLIQEQGPMLIATTCPACERAHAWRVDAQSAPEGEQVAHFAVPVKHMWDDVVFTCSRQRIFCSPDCVESWVQVHGRTRGEIADLAALWRLASGWYAGRLDRGYVRREPSQSAEYLRSVGLKGAFWGLPD
jgi:hypothetical protein